MNKTKIEPLYKDCEWLKREYGKYKSAYKVAEICGCSHRTIHNWLIKFGIERIGRINYRHSKETKEKIALSSKGRNPMLGKKHSDETRLKMSLSRKGKGNSNWKGGKTAVIRKFRHSKEYVNWRNDVMERANGKCQSCNKCLPLEAHHKVSLHKDFSLGLNLNNGIALCHNCHIEADRGNLQCKKLA